MIASRTNVLRNEPPAEQYSEALPELFPLVEDEDYRSVVSRIILEIRAEYGYRSAAELAKKVGSSEATILNAENGRNNLDPVTLLNIALRHGGEVRLKRVLALINGSPPAPITPFERLARANREIAVALNEMEGKR